MTAPDKRYFWRGIVSVSILYGIGLPLCAGLIAATESGNTLLGNIIMIALLLSGVISVVIFPSKQ